MNIVYTTQPVSKLRNSIFLAGPTPRSDDVESWRPEAIRIAKELGFSGTIYNPEHSNGQEGFRKSGYPAEWEHEAINASGIILFWVPRNMKDMPALTTNVEFGYFVTRNNIVYGRPDDAEHIRYLDWLYSKEHPKLKIYNSLDSLLEFAIKILAK